MAIALARRTGGTLHLVMVHDPSAYIPFVAGEMAVPVYDQVLEREHRDANARLLDEAVASLQREGVPATGALLDGAVAEVLAEYAVRVQADLTVMTTHGRGGFQRLRLGSVATQFLTRITHPVLLLRASEGEATPGFPAGPIVCALDGSAFAEAVLPHAIAFAEATACPLHLVGITVPHTMPMAPFGTEMMLLDDEALQLETSGRQEYLARVAGRCPAGTTHGTRTDMSVYRALLEEAEARGAGAIAIATHGRGGFSRVMLGSTTDDVIRHAQRPVLVFRPRAADGD